MLIGATNANVRVTCGEGSSSAVIGYGNLWEVQNVSSIPIRRIRLRSLYSLWTERTVNAGRLTLMACIFRRSVATGLTAEL